MQQALIVAAATLGVVCEEASGLREQRFYFTQPWGANEAGSSSAMWAAVLGPLRMIHVQSGAAETFPHGLN